MSCHCEWFCSSISFGASSFVCWTCLVGVIDELMVFHGLACVFACWILFEVVMYVFVVFLCLMIFFFFKFVIIFSEPLNLVGYSLVMVAFLL